MKLVIKAVVAVIFGGIFYFVGSLILGAFLDNRLLAQGIAGSLALVAALSAFSATTPARATGRRRPVTPQPIAHIIAILAAATSVAAMAAAFRENGI